MCAPPPTPAVPPAFVSLRWAVGVILLFGLLGRVLGLVREMIIASRFGTGAGLDAVYLGLSIPVALCLGLGGGAARAVVPAGAAAPAGGLLRLLGAMAARLLPVAVGAALGVAMAAPWLAGLLVAADGAVSRADVARVMAWGALAIVGGALAGLCSGLANSRGHHRAASVAPLAHNVCIIGSILLLGRSLGPFSVLVGVVVAEWAQLAALAPFLARLRSAVGAYPPQLLATAAALFWPAVVVTTAGGVMVAVDRSFAAGLDPGSVSALSYAERLLNFPVLLVAMALQQPLYTRLSHLVTPSRRRAFNHTLQLGLRVLVLFGVPVAAVTMGLAGPVVQLILERGAFGSSDTARAAIALTGYALGIPFLSMIPLLSSAGMARGRPWAVAAVYTGAVGANALLNALLVGPLGLAGITLASSLVAILTVVVLLLLAAPGLLRGARLWGTLLVALGVGAAGLAGLVAYRWALPAMMGETLAERLLYLAGGGVCFVTAALVVMGWVLRGEWRTLTRERALVAGIGARLNPSTADAPGRGADRG
jgi:putative peptidoglycan lipid II flippase